MRHSLHRHRRRRGAAGAAPAASWYPFSDGTRKAVGSWPTGGSAHGWPRGAWPPIPCADRPWRARCDAAAAAAAAASASSGRRRVRGVVDGDARARLGRLFGRPAVDMFGGSGWEPRSPGAPPAGIGAGWQGRGGKGAGAGAARWPRRGAIGRRDAGDAGGEGAEAASRSPMLGIGAAIGAGGIGSRR